ncbi:MAG: hypothetical protein COB02_11535 [Candidatus Cloacimonadota bacterium]|nr:MAG: hypothetical protein COB02_11535 [Candidatus Cloacimonadota bacterium]
MTILLIIGFLLIFPFALFKIIFSSVSGSESQEPSKLDYVEGLFECVDLFEIVGVGVEVVFEGIFVFIAGAFEILGNLLACLCFL